ncbi:FkbM family methyltransferase [Clostridiaceae bacterium]|nr:FkbM family methyltransferase [Clostridiaceae bacterium]
MELIEINFQSVNKEIQNSRNIIYGAGYNGRFLYELLSSNHIPVEAFYDDDESRWGDLFCDKKILSKNELDVLDKNTICILISSMYIGQITFKLEKMGFERAFVSFATLQEKDSDEFQFHKYKDNLDYRNDLENLINISKDDQTKRYFQLIKKSVTSGKALPEIVDLYCGEKQYFLNCFKGKLNGLSFLDGGAYTGDTVRELLGEEINPEGVYCFEANLVNYKKLKKFASENEKMCKLVCENLALWNENTKLGMEFENYNSRIDRNAKDLVVQAVTIDEYFRNKKLGFIKMDMEGAERKALEGGMKTIKRDRPILAISMYHGLDDIVEIPKMFMWKQEIKNYFFFVRHHSYTYSETVLYGIPEESNIL